MANTGKVKLSLMASDYDIVLPLKSGLVQPKGIDLVMAPYKGPRDLHHHAAMGTGAQMHECNAAHYVVQRALGRADVTAIPVFLHRRFRHGFVYVNTTKGIARPADLCGKRVGSRVFGPAASYWARGYIVEGGADYRSITWVVEAEDEVSRNLPAGVKIEILPKGKTVEAMLLTGEIDATIQPNINIDHAKGDPRVARLWANTRQAEIDYYKRTEIFPIMHVTTLPSEVVAKHPWVVESLVIAFEESKQLAYQRLANPRNVPLAWCETYRAEELALLGADPWEYGLSSRNKRNYEALVGYVHDQALTGPRPTLEELFPKEAFELELPLPLMHPATEFN